MEPIKVQYNAVPKCKKTNVSAVIRQELMWNVTAPYFLWQNR